MDDLLVAHGIMTRGLITETVMFRSRPVGVVVQEGNILHCQLIWAVPRFPVNFRSICLVSGLSGNINSLHRDKVPRITRRSCVRDSFPAIENSPTLLLVEFNNFLCILNKKCHYIITVSINLVKDFHLDLLIYNILF